MIEILKNKKQSLLSLATLIMIILLFKPAFGEDSSLPSSIIKLPDGENAIIVEKKTQTLLLISPKDDEQIIQLEMPCSTGEVQGKKQESGDKKTPEGVYFVKKEYEEKELGKIYGKKAFPLDYPNKMDHKIGNGGSAIWIHGTNKPLKPMNSNGCVVLENSNILELKQYITLNSTPVILTELLETSDKKTLEGQTTDISNMLDQFLDSITLSDYHIYLSFFSEKYLPVMSWWTKWLEILKTFADKDSIMTLERGNTGIYYHDNIFVCVFDFLLVVDGEEVLLGKLKLFLEKQEYAYKIIGDTYQTIEKEFQTGKESEEPPFFAGTLKIDKIKEDRLIRETLGQLLNQWLKAWSEKDIDTYASFYADDFYSDKMNKAQWIERKTRIADNNEFIKITADNVQVATKNDIFEISFFQDYKSDSYLSQGIKKLKLIKKDGSWKIYQESWKEK